MSRGHGPLSAVDAVRDRIAGSFGVTAESRNQLLDSMLEGHQKSAAVYWLYLVLSMAIATLGLVLGSTGIVIGAMLISPLMGPLVGLGMGLAVGSPVLTVRSFVRTGWSIVVVVIAAALLTNSLPFHENTAEILARTSPTALDLLVAIFCALTAAFTTARPASGDTASTAAGTAIGISLVPPLCVVGFGIGTGDAAVASGSALLFTANLCAILLFAALSFFLLGFDRVDVHALEHRYVEAGQRNVLMRLLHAGFGARYGRWLRVAMPLILLTSVFVPLKRALTKVSWEVTSRSRIHEILGALPEARRSVRSVVDVHPDSILVRLALVTDEANAARLEHSLGISIAAATGVVPKVEVLALPDLGALRAATRLSPIPVAAEPAFDFNRMRAHVAQVLHDAWPEEGGVRHWRLQIDETGRATVILDRDGLPIGSVASRLLARTLAERLAFAVDVVDLSQPATRIDATLAGDPTFMASLLTAGHLLGQSAQWKVCLGTPDVAALAAVGPAHARLRIFPSPTWSVQWTQEACDPPPAATPTAPPLEPAPVPQPVTATP